MAIVKQFFKKNDGTDILLFVISLVLVSFSILFYKERIIFTDTSVYAFTVANTGNFYIATNRFVCLLSQILPLIGVWLDLPLKAVLVLYSVNCILIPVTCSLICRCIFKDKATALAILLFYLLMSTWVFYYPVTEFQMGLSILFVYHAFALWYFQQSQQKKIVFYLVSLVMLVTITFSHPLAIYVFLGWLIWFWSTFPNCRKKILFAPLLTVGIAHLVKEQFFKTYVGKVIYDDMKKEGLKNFYAPISDYLNSPLAKAFYKILIQEYFIAIFITLLLVIFFILKRKWWPCLLFVGLLLGFWLLVTVSFPKSIYDHYIEHLYQPIPFFLALIFAYYLPHIVPQKILRLGIVGCVCLISFSKIYSNHDFFTRRLQWFQNYIGLMQSKGVRNGVLTPHYLAFWTQDAYWASTCESYLLSSLKGPDNTVNLIIDAGTHNATKAYSAEPNIKTKYFTLTNQPFQLVDHLASPHTLDSLRNVFD